MSELWVVNASPIITLAKAGHLHLLSDLAPEFQVPETVARELLAGGPEDPARQAIESGWGPRAPVGSIPAEILEWGLGQGESAVLAVAKERAQSVAVLDDAAARKCARTLGLPVIGTLGIAVRARVRELVPSASEVVRALRSAGLYLDNKTIRDALEGGVGEEWVP